MKGSKGVQGRRLVSPGGETLENTIIFILFNFNFWVIFQPHSLVCGCWLQAQWEGSKRGTTATTTWTFIQAAGKIQNRSKDSRVTISDYWADQGRAASWENETQVQTIQVRLVKKKTHNKRKQRWRASLRGPNSRNTNNNLNRRTRSTNLHWGSLLFYSAYICFVFFVLLNSLKTFVV